VIIAINQIGIAGNPVNTLFIGLVAAVSLAFGLAFGLGGRDVAAELTRSWYEQSQDAAAKVKARVEAAGSEPPSRSTAATRPATGSASAKPGP
jgi:hypothetical protein